MKSNPPSWSVGELAHRFDLPTHVLRHWESVGLLAPARDAAGRRRYGEDDAYRVAAIISSKRAGMSLDQIRSLLDGGAADRHRILEDHLTDLAARMAEMERSRHLTEHAMGCRAHDIANCPTFRSHVADLVAGSRRGLFSTDGHDGPGHRGIPVLE
ncbi:helix-turn-helix domain-containing protein [Nocardioides stalactiti]|uniref:helix-turn-helix domain-containing protein n=1 Tax=Nocardioides stalactiti TaxID=2755356 RepID=UPI0016047527|nr:MerR family transcriptional regulator [Nocardioides stalactiti]